MKCMPEILKKKEVILKHILHSGGLGVGGGGGGGRNKFNIAFQFSTQYVHNFNTNNIPRWLRPIYILTYSMDRCSSVYNHNINIDNIHQHKKTQIHNLILFML